MSKAPREKPLYQRGQYRLVRRAGRANLEIIWYDRGRSRERGISTGTSDVVEAQAALDRHYLATTTGANICPTCGGHIANGSAFVTAAIIDYLVMAEAKPSYDAIRARLAHVLTYIATHCPTVRCAAIDEPWIGRFRAWAVHQPIVSPKGVKRQRSPSTIENSVLQLAAVINAAFTRRDTISPAAFRPIPTREVNATPQYRSDVAELAAMFRYALEPNKKRGNLLAFLRASVATWARPDAVHDISTTPARRQWFAKAGVLALNPHGRRQTRKYRATIPVARQYRPHLESANGPIIAVKSVRSAWDAMALAIGLPGQGEGGMKLIRRSVAHIARRRIGEAHWVQGSIMLGHHKTSVSDIYALPDPANIGLALAATEAIIDEIELLAPGAFYRHFTAHNSNVIPIGCGK